MSDGPCAYDYLDEAGETLVCLVHRHSVQLFADPSRRTATLLEMAGQELLRGRAAEETARLKADAADPRRDREASA